MSNPNPQAKLRNILAELYPDEASMRRVASDAGLNITRITFGSNAINNWQAILMEAEHTNRMAALLAVVLDEYRENTKLNQAADAYRSSVEQSSTPDVSDKRSARYRRQWTLGVAALLVFIVGIMIWTIYRSSSPSMTPQSTPTAGQAVALVDTPTPSALPTNLPKVALTATPVSPTATVLPTNMPILPTAPIATWTNPKDGSVYGWISPGAFMMGSSITDTMAITDEKPLHNVSLPGFWIMQKEVTNAQYARCVSAGICEQPANKRWITASHAEHPVVDVSWDQAKTYAVWVNGRLPTEAEWEYACRGNDGRMYPWGNQSPSADRLNYLNSGKDDTTLVGSYPAGANGLYDMAGNVSEWTNSLYKKYPYNVADGREDPKVEGVRTIRGSSFYAYDFKVRCAYRDSDFPNVKSSKVGFRVVSDGP